MTNDTHTTQIVAMVIWISEEMELGLPFRGAALVYSFLKSRAVCVSSDLKWHKKRNVEISRDFKTARTRQGDCSAVWVLAEPALSQDYPSYFQIKIEKLGPQNSYCAVGIVESKIKKTKPFGAKWTEAKSIMFCNPGSGSGSWDAVVCSKLSYKSWEGDFRKGDILTFLYIPQEGKLAVHCKRFGRCGCRVPFLKIPNVQLRSDDSFHVMFAAAMKDDSLVLMSKNVKLPKPLQKLLDRRVDDE